MVRFLFWNICKKDLTRQIAILCKEHSVDVLILAETEIDELLLTRELANTTGYRYFPANNLSEYIKFYTKYMPGKVINEMDMKRISIKSLHPPIGPSIIVAGVHLPSKIHQSDDDQLFQARRLSREVSNIEKKLGHDHSILIGDFNMNPFEKSLVSADGLHAIMDRKIAAKKSRIIQGEEREFFYNPMWSHLGDTLEHAGTHYYDSSNMVNYYWNMFDQAMIRPSLIKYYDSNGMKIINSVSGESLIKGGKIDTSISDHLPIYINVETEKGAWL